MCDVLTKELTPGNSVFLIFLYNATAYAIMVLGAKLFQAAGSAVTMAVFLCKVEKGQYQREDLGPLSPKTNHRTNC